MPSHTHTFEGLWTEYDGWASQTIGLTYSFLLSSGAIGNSSLRSNYTAHALRVGYGATNGNTGGDGYHNNIQPYITVYMYRRIANSGSC